MYRVSINSLDKPRNSNIDFKYTSVHKIKTFVRVPVTTPPYPSVRARIEIESENRSRFLRANETLFTLPEDDASGITMRFDHRA